MSTELNAPDCSSPDTRAVASQVSFTISGELIVDLIIFGFIYLLRENRPFLTGEEEDQTLLETKLVNILDDLVVEDFGDLVAEEVVTEGVLTMLKLRKEEELFTEEEEEEEEELFTEEEEEEEEEEQKEETRERQFVKPYDMGGHSSYLNSQRLFKSGSSLFFLAFQR